MLLILTTLLVNTPYLVQYTDRGSGAVLLPKNSFSDREFVIIFHTFVIYSTNNDQD